MQTAGMLRGTRVICSLLLLVPLIDLARSAPYQVLPSVPGFIPVYIRFGDQPLEEVNPALAEAFHEKRSPPKNVHEEVKVPNAIPVTIVQDDVENKYDIKEDILYPFDVRMADEPRPEESETGVDDGESGKKSHVTATDTEKNQRNSNHRAESVVQHIPAKDEISKELRSEDKNIVKYKIRRNIASPSGLSRFVTDDVQSKIIIDREASEFASVIKLESPQVEGKPVYKFTLPRTKISSEEDTFTTVSVNDETVKEQPYEGASSDVFKISSANAIEKNLVNRRLSHSSRNFENTLESSTKPHPVSNNEPASEETEKNDESDTPVVKLQLPPELLSLTYKISPTIANNGSSDDNNKRLTAKS